MAAVLKSYTMVNPSDPSKTEDGETHVVMAYGYKDGKLLANFGWWPNSHHYTQVIINSANIYGYFSVKYTGEHRHSANAYWEGRNEYVCGCGFFK